jgi:hypothetical protein
MRTEVYEAQPHDAAQSEGLARRLNRQHFLYFSGEALADTLNLISEDIGEFSMFWSRLTTDRYMGDGGTYRLRRYGEFDSRPGLGRLQRPHGPYVQPKYINSLNGDIARVFDPLEPEFVTNRVLNCLLDWLTALYDQCEGTPQCWNIRLHPYRILASQQKNGNPTPEGLHRDGVDYIVSMMVSRSNVMGGITTITDNNRQVLWERMLQSPMDILIGKDAHTMHSVSPVSPVDAHLDAHRDVLVIAFTKMAT